MTDLIKFNGNGKSKLKYEVYDSRRGKRQKVKLQISGFPQRELARRKDTGGMRFICLDLGPLNFLKKSGF
jgi:hypothetical protein